MTDAIQDYIFVIRSCLHDIQDGDLDRATNQIIELTEEFRRDVVMGERLQE